MTTPLQGPSEVLRDECRSFWSIYRFQDEAKEEQFLRRCRRDLLWGCQIWCATHLVIALLLPLFGVFYGLGANFFLTHVPTISIPCACLLLLHCLGPLSRRIRDNVALLVSVACVLMAVAAGWTVHAQSRVWVQHALQHSLPLVVNQIKDPAAMQQLEAYLHESMSTSVLNLQLALSVVQALLLAFVGFYRSTACACILMPAGLLTALLVSPDMRQHLFVVETRSASMFVSGGVLLALMCRNTWMWRYRFILERFFAGALDTAVQSSRQADSILNHTLKNCMADGAGEIELFLESVDQDDPTYTQLSNAAISLQRGMRACRQRQAYLYLAAGSYRLSLQAVALHTFAKEITAGRDMITDVTSLWVLLDPTLLGLIFDNVISNAFNHGHPSHPQVTFTIKELHIVQEEAPKQVMLSFQVCNAANPARPAVTPGYIAKVLAGKADTAGPSSRALSDRIGLQHSFLAADAHNMTISFTQTGSTVLFDLQVQAEVVQPPESASQDGPGADFPPNLKICCIDDSATVRRLLQRNLRHCARTENVHVFGRDAAEVEAFLAEVLAGGDIAVLDQHLAYPGRKPILGTDLARRLLARGFGGLLCICSANAEAEDLRRYAEAGVHCSFGKDMLMKNMIREMMEAYRQFIEPDARAPRQSAASAGPASSQDTWQDAVFLPSPSVPDLASGSAARGSGSGGSPGSLPPRNPLFRSSIVQPQALGDVRAVEPREVADSPPPRRPEAAEMFGLASLPALDVMPSVGLPMTEV